jgi:hypothetical protein
MTRTAYFFQYKNTPRARNIMSGVRFYTSDEEARADMIRLVAEETYGDGVLISVEPTEDPR